MRRFLILVTTICLFLWSTGAAAQGTSDVDKARSLAGKGLQDYNKQQWEQAYKKFEQAEQLSHNPNVVLHMARCKRQLGQLLEAKALYERVTTEKLEADAADIHVKAQGEAGNELTELISKIPAIVITAQGDGVAELDVQIDGTRVTLGNAALRVPLNPGAHTLKSSTPWSEPKTQQVTLAEGTEERVVLDAFRPKVNDPPPPKDDKVRPKDQVRDVLSVVPTGQPTTPPIPPQPVPGASRLTWVAFSLGGAGIVAGAVTGMLALSFGSEALASCEPRSTIGGNAGPRCLTPVMSKYETALMLGKVSPAAFAVGVAGLGAGIGLFLTSSNGTKGPPNSGQFVLKLAPAWIGMEGTF